MKEKKLIKIIYDFRTNTKYYLINAQEFQDNGNQFQGLKDLLNYLGFEMLENELEDLIEGKYTEVDYLESLLGKKKYYIDFDMIH